MLSRPPIVYDPPQAPPDPDLVERVLQLKVERNAIVLAHNYQVGEVQDVADVIGDSLGLAQAAARTDADVILFCGVRFMAETAAILNPTKTVLMPDLKAGCSLADMITADELRAWKALHPGAVVVSYINTTADVKAESDYICTSTNALKVIGAIPREREILFLPDKYLGTYLQQKSGRSMHVWPGYCPTHVSIRSEEIEALKFEHPAARFLMHPECGCMTSCMGLADAVLSTEGMVRYVRDSPETEFIIGTETGILHKMRKENPGKMLYPAAAEAVCPHMKVNSLEKVLWSLEDLQPRVTVDPETARRARKAIDRMLELA
ncbi:MAG: quinolinate synthase NadA [Euryarchaeota archaeon]|nr:quinolinate synthase NadA [Euryarchaeota archaeon]